MFGPLNFMMIENLEKYSYNTPHGRIISTENFPNGNMIRSTAELLLLASDRLTPDELLAYQNGLRDMEQPTFGVFTRYQSRLENTSVDDYLLAGTDKLIAQSILDNARKNWGCCSVDGKWSKDQFLFRFQGMWQNLRMVAGECVGIIGQLIWAGNLVLATRQPPSNQDNWALSHAVVVSYEKGNFQSPICDWAVAYFKAKKPKPTYQLMIDYLGIPDHPIVQAWKPYD